MARAMWKASLDLGTRMVDPNDERPVPSEELDLVQPLRSLGRRLDQGRELKRDVARERRGARVGTAAKPSPSRARRSRRTPAAPSLTLVVNHEEKSKRDPGR